MANFHEVKKYVTKTVKKELAPTRIVKINMRESVTSSDGEPAYQIDIVFDGDRPDARKMGNLRLAVKDHLWEIRDGHYPMFSILRPEDEEWYYASAVAGHRLGEATGGQDHAAR